LLFWPLLALLFPYLLWQVAQRPGQQRTRGLHAALAVCLPIGAGFMVFDLLPAGHSFLFYTALFGAMVAAGALPPARRGFARFAPFPTVGALGTAALLYAMTFRPIWEELVRPRASVESGVFWSFVGIVLAALALLHATRSLDRHDWPQAALAFVPALAMFSYFLAHDETGLVLAIALCNLYALALGLCFLLPGVSAGRLLQANQGLLWITLIFLARFFDADMSFVVRGIGFIAAGAAFLVTNLLVVRKRRQFA
jgi:hypothetical protein